MEKLKTYSPDLFKNSKPRLTYLVSVTSFDKTTGILVYDNPKVTNERSVDTPKEVKIPWGNSVYLMTTSTLRAGDKIYIVCTNPATIRKVDYSSRKGGTPQRLPLVDGSSLSVYRTPDNYTSLTPDRLMGQPATKPVIVPIALPELPHPIEEILRIGYTDLTSNAEALIVEQEVSIDEVPLVRNRGSIKKGHGHSLRKISIPLMFTDERDTMKLCHLLRQVRHMPILPIENAELEGKGIDAIAITGVNVSTIEGFPGSFSAQIDAVEFDWRQYFPDDDSKNFTELWNWPLFKMWCERDSGRAPYPQWSPSKYVDGNLTFRSPKINAVVNFEDYKSLLVDSGSKLNDATKAGYVVKKANQISSGWLPKNKQALRAKSNERVVGRISESQYYGDIYQDDSAASRSQVLLSEDNTDPGLAYFRAVPIGGSSTANTAEESKGPIVNYGMFRVNSLESLKLAHSLALLSKEVIVLKQSPIFTQGINGKLLLHLPGNYDNQLVKLGNDLDISKKGTRNAEINPASYTIIADVNSIFWKQLSSQAGKLIALTSDQSVALPDDDEYWVSWEFDWSLESIAAGFMNIFSAQQTSSQQAPALQFMGGSDVQLRVAGTVFSSKEATSIQEMLDYVDSLARDFSGLGLVNSYGGFLHISNELSDLLGVEWVLPRSLQVTTVPEFPDERGFLLVLEEFDLAQDKREELKDVFPSKKAGMPSSLADLERIDDGIVDRAIRLRDFEVTLKDNEIYPDLNLPTNVELNNMIIELRRSLGSSKTSFITNTSGDEVDGPYWDTNNEEFKTQVGLLASSTETIGFAEPDFFCVSKFQLGLGVNSVLESSHNLQTTKVISQDKTVAYLTPGKKLDSVGQILNEIGIRNPGILEEQKKLYDQYNQIPSTRIKAETSLGLQQATLPGGSLDLSGETTKISLSQADAKSLTEASSEWGIASSNPDTEIKRIKSIIGTIVKSPIGGKNNKTPLTPLLVNGSLEKLILTSAKMTNVDPAFIKAIIHAESNAGLDPSSMVFNKSGFIGLMQLSTEEGARFGVDIKTSEGNILGGARQIVEKIGAIKSRKVGLLAAAYNGGQKYAREGNLGHYEGNAETYAHTRRVFSMYLIYRLQYILNGIMKSPMSSVPPSMTKEVTNLAAFALEFLKGTPPVYSNLTIDSGDVSQYVDFNYNSATTKSLARKVMAEKFKNSDAEKQEKGMYSAYGNALLQGQLSNLGRGSEFDTNSTFSRIKFNTFKEIEKGNPIFEDLKTADSMYSNSENQIEGMLEDNNNYEMMNRLVLAFPAYSVILVDGGRWLRAWRLFDRMFGLFGVSSLQVFKTREDPASVAQVVFSNMYGRLSNQIADNDRANKAGTTRFTVPWIGEMISQAIAPTPNEEMLNIRAQVINSLLLKAGTRLHIRLGYGSDSSKFPVLFNGTIIEVPVDYDSVRVVALGDGHELKKDIAPQMQTATDSGESAYRITALFGGGKDPRNTLIELFTQTSDTLLGDLANRATDGWYIHNNLNGIENFGRAVYDKDGKAGTVISTAELGVNIYALRSDPVNQTTAASNTLGWLWSDSDINVGINVPNATTWAVAETVRKLSPDFVLSVHEFGLRSTLFMGRPYWNLFYDYDPALIDRLIEADGKDVTFTDPNQPGLTFIAKGGNIPPDLAHVVMKKKVFQQLRVITSEYNLFETAIAASSEEVYTACQLSEESAGFKTLLNGPRTFSTFRYFDNEIYTENIRVKTGQSNVLVLANNQLGNITREMSFSGLVSSSRANENVTLSELKDGLKKMYKGHFLVRGDASYKPYDLVYVADFTKNLSGLCQIREVVHEFSMDTGFVTTITPDICVTAVDPGEVQLLTSAMQVGSAIVVRRTALNMAAKVYSGIKKGALLGKGVDEISTKLKSFTTNSKVKASIDTAVSELKASGFFSTEKTGAQTIRAIAEKVKAKGLLDSKLYPKFASIIAKAQGLYSLEKVGEFKTAASTALKGIVGNTTELVSKLKAGGSKFYEIIADQSSVKGLMQFAKAAKLGNIVATLGIIILVDNVAEIINRKFGARKSCILIPLRKSGKELTAGITGHKGGVLGDPASPVEASIRMYTNANTAVSKLGEAYENNRLGTLEGVNAIAASVFSGLLLIFGVQSPDNPVYDWSEQDALSTWGMDNFRPISHLHNTNAVVGNTPPVPGATPGGGDRAIVGTEASVKASGRLLNTPSSQKRKLIIDTARSLIGTPYVYGAPEGQTSTVDCSSFVQYCYKKAGISIPRTTDTQFPKGISITEDQVVTGDLIFFKGTNRAKGANQISHVGIYISPGIMIHASSSKGVTIGSYRTGYFNSHFAGFRRII